MDVQTITNTFSEDFQQLRYSGKERESSCTNFFNLSCLATSWNHQKQRRTEEANKF